MEKLEEKLKRVFSKYDIAANTTKDTLQIFL